MRRFSYLFELDPEIGIHESVRLVFDLMLRTRLLKPRVKATLIKSGPITADGLIGQKISLPQVLHFLDCENPWRKHGPRNIAPAWWRGKIVYACSVYGLDVERAEKLVVAIGGCDSFLTAVPPTDNPVCEYLLDKCLMPLVAFHRYGCAISGALSISELTAYKLGKLTYMDPDLFMLRDSIRHWAGEVSEGDCRPSLF